MEILEYLKNRINESMQLSELISIFEKMCQIKLDFVDKDEDMILFETGTFSFSGQSMFYFSLVRQFPNEEEEYIQLHLDIHYNPSESNKLFSEPIWSEDVKGNFFDFIRNSAAYLALKNEKIENIDIFMDET